MCVNGYELPTLTASTSDMKAKGGPTCRCSGRLGERRSSGLRLSIEIDRCFLPMKQCAARLADHEEDLARSMKRSAAFAGMVEGMTGCRDPRRVGNWENFGR